MFYPQKIEINVAMKSSTMNIMSYIAFITLTLGCCLNVATVTSCKLFKNFIGKCFAHYSSFHYEQPQPKTLYNEKRSLTETRKDLPLSENTEKKESVQVCRKNSSQEGPKMQKPKDEDYDLLEDWELNDGEVSWFP
jgi:hypothetical protein